MGSGEQGPTTCLPSPPRLPVTSAISPVLGITPERSKVKALVKGCIQKGLGGLLRWAGTPPPWLWLCLLEAGVSPPRPPWGPQELALRAGNRAAGPCEDNPLYPPPPQEPRGSPGAHAVPKPGSVLRGDFLPVSSSLGLCLPLAEATCPLSVPVSPSLPHYLPLSASAGAVSVPAGPPPRVPRPPRAPPSATAPSGLPPYWLRPGARVTAPRPAPRFPASWHCGPRRLGAGTGWGHRWSPPDAAGALGRAVARARSGRAPGRMGCTVSLVCCEALEPGPLCGPQPPGSAPAPAPREYRELRGSVRAQSRRLLLQVGRCAGRWQAQPGSPETGKEPRGESTQHGSGRAGAWTR